MTRLLTTEQYLQTPRPQLNWIVDQQLPYPGILLIEGPPKVGKSFLAFDLLRCVSQGKPFLGWKTHKRTCLYLQFDTSELIWRQRLDKMKSSGLELSGDLYTVHPEDMILPFNISNLQHQHWLRNLVRDSNCDVFCIDVFREIHNSDENDSTQMKIVGDILVNIFKTKTLILVHHSKKINEDYITHIDPS